MQPPRERDDPTVAVLGIRQADFRGAAEDVLPAERRDLAVPPARQPREFRSVPVVVGKLGVDRVEHLDPRRDLPRPARSDAGDVGGDGETALALGERDRAAQEHQLLPERPVGDALSPPAGDVAVRRRDGQLEDAEIAERGAHGLQVAFDLHQ